MAFASNPVEHHPLAPFLPPKARLLMLGSFPPPRKRWSIDFYYPNFNNDMWRIMGLLFFGAKEHFVDVHQRAFRKEPIIDFLSATGIALYDTAAAVRRLKDNAADQFLKVVEATDVGALLRQLPECCAVAVTGQKATDTLRAQLDAAEPAVGGSSEFTLNGRAMRLYRMPSSSRAYPLPLPRKAAMYGAMFSELSIKTKLTTQQENL